MNRIASKKFPGYILALTGPSGVGKSTLRRLLVQTAGDYIEEVKMVTTRSPRQDDDGEYLYSSNEKFERMKQDEIIVAFTEIPSSNENRQYGYRGKDIEAVWDRGKIPVVITEMRLLESLARQYGRDSILSFGLLPPGTSKRAKLSELLHRLRGRGRDTEAHIRDRLKNAESDIRLLKDRKDLFDHIVVNENLQSLMALVKSKALSFAKVPRITK